MEHGPEFSDVSGKGDVSVQDDDSMQVGGQRLGEHQLHEAVDPRVVLVWDPRHLRLKHKARVSEVGGRARRRAVVGPQRPPHLQLICIIEVDSDSRNHPGVEQRGKDLLSNGVCDEVEVQRVPPEGTEAREHGSNISNRPVESETTQILRGQQTSESSCPQK